MVELLKGFPPHVVAYRASAAISKEEYKAVVMNRVNEVAHAYGKINFLVLLHTKLENYSIGAFIYYVQISFKHFTRWNRMAIVSDQKWVRAAYRVLGALVPGEIRCYQLKDFEQAREWVSHT